MRKFWFSLLCLLPLQVFAVLPEINFAQQPNIYKEGESVTLTVELSAPTVQGVSVKLYLESVSTAGMADTDLNLSNTVIHISPGESQGSITFNVLEDSETEEIEYFALKMGPTQNAIPGIYSSIMLHFIEGLINEPSLPKVNFVQSRSDISEGSRVEVKMTLTSPSDSPVVVPISICGTSEYPSDHDLFTKEVVFSPGTTEVVLSIRTFEDYIQEGSEDIVIKLLSPITNAELGILTEHSVSILDLPESMPLH